MTRAVPVVVAAAAVLVVAATSHRGGIVAVVAAVVVSAVACWATSALAARIAGERFALAAGLVYALLPLIGLAYFLPGFRHAFAHRSAPGVVGLVATWRLALGAVIAAAVAFAPRRATAVAGAAAVVVALAVAGGGGLADVRNGLHETGWSTAFLEWLFVAGTFGAIRKAPPLGVAVAGWAAATVIVASGDYPGDAAFWARLAPAAPAIAILVTSIALLVPRLQTLRARPAPDRGG